jgi:hypothetical protein
MASAPRGRVGPSRNVTRGLALLGALTALAPAFVANAQDAGAPTTTVAALVAAPAANALPLRTRLQGMFRPAPGAPNEANRDAGIRRAVEALFALIRPIATSRITDGNPVFPSVRIAFYDGTIDVATPPVIARSPENGATRTVTGLDRETNQLVQSFTSDALVQTTWTDAGSRTTRFVPSADGQRLTLHIQIRSPRLPVPVRYTMAYARSAR